MKPTHTYHWGNTPERAARKGQRCTVVRTGRMRTAVVEFEDGERMVTSLRALRRIAEAQ